MKIASSILFHLFATTSWPAMAELSAFEQALESNQTIETRESTEVRNGIEYRKVESSLGLFYLKLLARRKEVSELECNTNFNANSPHLVTASVQVFKRSRAFIRGLKESCESKGGQQRVHFNWSSSDIQLGFQIPDSKNGKLKDREVQINPLGGMGAGFSGSFE